MLYHTVYPSPLGTLYLTSDGKALTGLWMEGQTYFGAAEDTWAAESSDLPVFSQAVSWLDAYFKKAPLPPMPPLAPAGSPFRLAVWRLLENIPFGETTTYGDLTQVLQKQGIAASPQGVGGAVGHNPISILIPCHRVLGRDGSLTGYAGGLDRKRFLLELEGIVLPA